jgi:hypothetical protein
MVQTDATTQPTPTTGAWPARTAGGLVVLLGLANTVLGLLAMATDIILLSPGAAGGLLVIGLATIALGVMVLRGSRAAATAALTVFAILLVLQLGDAASGGTGADGAVGRSLVLLVVVLALAWGRRSVASR